VTNPAHTDRISKVHALVRTIVSISEIDLTGPIERAMTDGR
jgi:hypothetical protein